MDKKLVNYQRFFEDQIREHDNEYKDVALSPIGQSMQDNKCFFGTIVGTDNESGSIILKVRKGHAPRLKILMDMCVLRGPSFDELGQNIGSWRISLQEFVNNKRYHTPFVDLKPLRYIKKNDPAFDFLKCDGCTIDLYSNIESALKKGVSPWFILVDKLPPTQYLRNLIGYIDRCHEDPDLLLEPKITYPQWTPEELTNKDDIPGRLIESLEKDGVCIVQGPPGTGKSYSIAEVANRYLDKGKIVCATSMSNKGLTELIEKKPLTNARTEGRVYKTLLTAEETKRIPGTKMANRELVVGNGELLCATYYKLSSKIHCIVLNSEDTPIYDLVIIEEASQAYLTAIAAFRKLGVHCLIVGDPMQLPPIVLEEDKNDYKSWNVPVQANGLMTFALGSNVKCFRITTSYRLVPASTSLTKVFYNGSLSSVLDKPLSFSQVSHNLYFPVAGGTIIQYLKGAKDIICSDAALSVMHTVVADIIQNYPDRKIAIISPFIKTVEKLQREFYYDHQEADITVDTVDRVQGMTVSYTIVYYPNRKIDFELNENRFNVATSRSESTTLILADMPLIGYPTTAATVHEYLSQCPYIEDGRMVFPAEITKQSGQTQGGIQPLGKIDLSSTKKPNKEIRSDRVNYYVVDTNAFVNCPTIIEKIDPRYTVLLSAKVVDELDNLKVKTSGDTLSNIQAALRSINHLMDKRKIRMEEADPSLLPQEMNRKNADNLILSVALKYLGDNPILITSDNGLQVKAKGLGVTTISLSEFLKNTSSRG
jgi:rRNA-processing protein FCF1